jgi:hypothetical protein
MNRKPRTPWTLLATALLVVVALTTGAAFAHIKDEAAEVYYQWAPDSISGPGPVCVKGLARVANGNYDHGFSRSKTNSYTDAFNGRCNWDKDKNPGRIAAGMWWWKWSNDTNKPRMCLSFGFAYNGKETNYLTWYHDFLKIRCGKGYYLTQSGNFVYWQGEWRGGFLTSPWHLFL